MRIWFVIAILTLAAGCRGSAMDVQIEVRRSDTGDIVSRARVMAVYTRFAGDICAPGDTEALTDSRGIAQLKIVKWRRGVGFTATSSGFGTSSYWRFPEQAQDTRTRLKSAPWPPHHLTIWLWP